MTTPGMSMSLLLVDEIVEQPSSSTDTFFCYKVIIFGFYKADEEPPWAELNLLLDKDDLMFQLVKDPLPL